ncbi:DUF202 domain-containing protein [Pseudomonas putida]
MRDPGLQAERTALSWNRTGLAVLLNGLLALRSGWLGQHVALTALAAVLLLMAAGVMVYALRRKQQLAQGLTGARPLALVQVGLIGTTTCLIGLATLIH